MDQQKDLGRMKFLKIKGNANHHLFWRGSRIWVRFSKTGKRPLEKSLKTDIVETARVRRDDEIAKYLGTTPRWRGPTFLVEDKFPLYVEMKKTKAPRTYQSIKGHWEKHLKPYFGALRLEDVTESEWLKYVYEKRRINPSRKFFNDRKYMSMFLNWLHREGILKQLPRLEGVDPERKSGKVFSDKEVKELLKNSSGDLHLQILMAVNMGMRKGEIFSLEWGQIDFDKGSIFLPAEKTKIRKARTFAISDVVLSELQGRHKVRKAEWVFPGKRGRQGPISSNQKAWKACKKVAGVSGRFHDLRHTFLTKAFKEAVNPALICEYAGLSMEEAQRTYLHFNMDDTRVVSNLVKFSSFFMGGILWQNLDTSRFFQ